MRDPKRIEEVTNLLKEVWLQYPDLRFWQLLSAIPMSKFTKANDLFYVEDDVTANALKSMIEEK